MLLDESLLIRFGISANGPFLAAATAREQSYHWTLSVSSQHTPAQLAAPPLSQGRIILRVRSAAFQASVTSAARGNKVRISLPLSSRRLGPMRHYIPSFVIHYG